MSDQLGETADVTWPAAVRWTSLASATFMLAAAAVDYGLKLYHGVPLAAASAALVGFACAVGALTIGRQRRALARFVAWQALVIGGLGLINLASEAIQPFGHNAPLWANVVNLTVERNFPTFYSSYLLISVAIVVLACLWRERGERSGWARDDYAWIFVAFGFVFLALDETLMIHEALNDTLRRHMNIEALHGNYWTLVYFPVGVVGLVICLPWAWKRFLSKPRVLALFVLAVVLEVLSPLLEIAGVTVARENHLYKIVSVIEEMAEMFAAVAFLAGFALFEETLVEQAIVRVNGGKSESRWVAS